MGSRLMRRHRVTAWVIVLAASGVLLPRKAAADPGARPRLGIAVHPEVGFALAPGGNGGGANSTPGIAEAGLGVGYEIRSSLELELTIANCVSSSRAVMDPSGKGVDSVPTTVGILSRLLARYHLGRPGAGGVLGIGPAMVTNGSFGTVPLLDVEGGFEVRATSGFYFAAVLQLIEPLMVSRPELDPTRCQTADCPSRFDPTHPVVGSRFAIGWVF